jgi:Cof subfamily protein (haloacid dehalogenase superfamily)
VAFHPPMIALLALDLDGTVIDDALTISPVVVDAVAAAMARGVHVTIVTGRMFAATLPHARMLGIRGPVVCYQGAGIYDVGSGSALYEELLPNALLMRVYERAKRDGFHLQMYKDDRFYVEEQNAYTTFYARLAGLEPIVVPSLAQAFVGRGSLKVNMNADAQRIAAYESVMREYLGEQAYVTRSLPEFLEVMSPRVSKGAALRFVAEYLGVPLHQTMAVGDSYNDISLLRTAGLGVAMGSAPRELRDAADAVVGDCSHNGVAEAIERFVLGVQGV